MLKNRLSVIDKKIGKNKKKFNIFTKISPCVHNLFIINW